MEKTLKKTWSSLLADSLVSSFTFLKEMLPSEICLVRLNISCDLLEIWNHQEQWQLKIVLSQKCQECKEKRSSCCAKSLFLFFELTENLKCPNNVYMKFCSVIMNNAYFLACQQVPSIFPGYCNVRCTHAKALSKRKVHHKSRDKKWWYF